MNIRQVKEFFKDKKNAPCPLTERLIRAGYQQTGAGYIALAKKRGLVVDYTKAEPTQYWHLMEEYVPSVPEDKLKELLERIIADGNSTTPPKYDRVKWNKEIQNLCFDAIVNVVENR